ncbi:glycosyltransferase family 4 protein [Candidatus Magnetobacterium casense]|uniref:Glycosyltransferase family 4 protein n=1 Tax=Candidatus Magnetobacterium casense TaxID=1455061 RepID=A0ABS6S426_9BACT|nr:glycosyltransferase family 1 protein [Candidatus Magnetobacterium casensis]MBV6343591.1 glycosyltransferase family 4 protein [Candidatus Magnetobacterium casensis]
MKIAINASFLNTKPTGVGVFTREVARELCALDKETTVFSSVRIDGVDESQMQHTPQPIRGSLNLIHNIGRAVFDNALLRYRLHAAAVDVLLCPIMEFPLTYVLPTIVMVHDLHPLYFPEQFGVASKYFRVSLWRLKSLRYRVLTPSNFVRAEVIKTAGLQEDLVGVAPYGYDSNMFKPMPAELREDFLKRHDLKPPYILFVGSLFPYKNVSTLTDAFMLIKNRVPHTLVIVGKKELATRPLPKDDRIVYKSYVDREDVPLFYSYAEMLVHPSLFEGFGLNILEAMACGTPVVSSNGGSLPEVVGQAGLLFNPTEVTTLATHMLNLIRDKELRQSLIERGLQHVKTFTWLKTAQDIYNTCKKCL